MKKFLCIMLSLLLVAGTMSVLSTLGVTAEGSSPANLIVNGDASGVEIGGVNKLRYDSDDEAAAVYAGEKKSGNVYGWRNTTGNIYANTQLCSPLSSSYGKYQTYSNFSPTNAVQLNV